MNDIMKSLRTDHENMTILLDIFEHQLRIFEQGGSPDYEIIDSMLEYCLNYPDLYHHPKEDAIFRALKAKDAEVVRKMGDLETLHSELGELTRRLAAAVRQILLEHEIDRAAVVKLANEFVDKYRHHIEAEDTYFFPVAEDILDLEDWNAVDRDLKPLQEPLFGPTATQEFQRLREAIMKWGEVRKTG